MCRPARWLASALLGLGCSIQAAHAQADAAPRLSGYYKNLLLRSETWAGERFDLDLNRLRLKVEGELAPRLAFELQYDNEVLLGDYLRTMQFQQQKDIPPPQYWRADANYVERPSLYGAHRLYRALLTAAFGDTDLRLGRQRIAWGTGRFWSPLDLLNPFSPVALERDERLGVDALLVERKFGPISRLSAVYAPSRAPHRDSLALQWHDNAHAVDYSVTAGRFADDDVIGVDLAGQASEAGVRAELTGVRTREGQSFTRALIGADYAFANTLTLSAELYRDGGGARSTAEYDFLALATGARQTLARHYFGLHGAYEITPLLKLSAEFVFNLDDGSRFVAPGITYSIRDNLDATLGLRWFSGRAGSEYARPPDAVYASVQRFF